MRAVDSPIIFCQPSSLPHYSLGGHNYIPTLLYILKTVLGLYKNMTHFQNGMDGIHSFHWEVLLHAINIKNTIKNLTFLKLNGM
jgi:hypothetical protein